MPLRIKMPSKDRIVVNGAVIENAGEATTIVLHNKADVLRRKEVMTQEEANTPARHVYYSLQCAYIFDEDRERYLDLAVQYLQQYIEAAPSAKDVVSKIIGDIREERYYNALRGTQKLIDHETERMQSVGQTSNGE